MAYQPNLPSVVSTNNSTTSTLLAAATFTGTGDDCLNYSEIRVTVIASHASATDGLSMQQSSDNSNWDITDTYTIAATTGKTFVVPRQARYLRVVYTNGGTNQSSFRLQTILNRTGTTPTSQRAQDAYTNETDLQEVWAFSSVYNGTGWDRMRGDTTNGLDVDVTRLIPGTTATALGKAEDTVHATGDTGVFSLGIGNEAQTTLAADGDYIGHSTDVKGNALTVGNLAHDAVDAGFPLKTGGQARTTNPTAVSDADRVNFIADKLGKQVVVGSIRDMKVAQTTTITASVSETTVLTAVASTFLDVYGVIVGNSSVTGCTITFKDATAGTTRFTIVVPAGETRGFTLPESGAYVQAAVNNNWTATCSASLTSIFITMLAVKNT